MPDSFELHERLDKDSRLLGYFPLSQLRLILDANYPWFILVPQRAAIEEIHQLSDQDQQQLMRESSQLSLELSRVFCADKMNIAAIGNIVPQLHVHHIVRYENDIAWPSPVWGKVPATIYNDKALQSILNKIRQCWMCDFSPL